MKTNPSDALSDAAIEALREQIIEMHSACRREECMRPSHDTRCRYECGNVERAAEVLIAGLLAERRACQAADARALEAAPEVVRDWLIKHERWAQERHEQPAALHGALLALLRLNESLREEIRSYENAAVDEDARRDSRNREPSRMPFVSRLDARAKLHSGGDTENGSRTDEHGVPAMQTSGNPVQPRQGKSGDVAGEDGGAVSAMPSPAARSLIEAQHRDELRRVALAVAKAAADKIGHYIEPPDSPEFEEEMAPIVDAILAEPRRSEDPTDAE